MLLTGISSSGKTSTTNALKNIYGHSYTIINYDDFLDGKNWEKIKEQLALEWGWNNNSNIDLETFIEQYLNSSNKEKERKVFEEAMNNGSLRFIQKQTSLTKNVLIDTTQSYVYENFSTIFPNHTPIKVLLYCPLSIIGKRIEQRNMSNDPNELRSLWQPFLGFSNVYKIKEFNDEIVVDTMFYSDQLKQIVINGIESVKKDLFSEYDNLQQLKLFEDFYKKFLKELEKNNQVIITTQIPFDLVINTSIYSPDEVAKIIIDFAQKHEC